MMQDYPNLNETLNSLYNRRFRVLRNARSLAGARRYAETIEHMYTSVKIQHMGRGDYRVLAYGEKKQVSS